MTIHRWRAALIIEGQLRIIGYWTGQPGQRLYQLSGIPPKPSAAAGKMLHPNVTPEPEGLLFSEVTETTNKENTERDRAAGFDPRSKNAPISGPWLELQEQIQRRTGQLLDRVALGTLARELKRRGLKFYQLIATVASHPIERSRSAFAVLWSLVRNNLCWPRWKRTEEKPEDRAAPPRQKREKAEVRRQQQRDRAAANLAEFFGLTERKPDGV